MEVIKETRSDHQLSPTQRRSTLDTFAQALQLSAHVLLRDPDQLTGQMASRLGAVDDPFIAALVQQGSQKKKTPWLRPLTASLAAPGGPLVRTLVGHRDQVEAVALDRSGRLAASISRDKTLHLWDLHSGEIQASLNTTGEAWNALALSPDGSRVVCQSGSFLGATLEIWDFHQERPVGMMVRDDEGDELLAGVPQIFFLPDGSHLVATSHRTVDLWDVDRGSWVTTLGTHDQAIHALAVACSGRLVATGAENEIKIWELDWTRFSSGQAGALKHKLASKAGMMTSDWSNNATPSAITFFQDDRLILVAYNNNVLETWDVEAGRLEASWRGLGDDLLLTKDEIKSIAVSGDATLAVLGIRDGRILVQELSTGATRETLAAHDSALVSLASFPQGAGFLSASWDGTLKHWDMARLENRQAMEGGAPGEIQVLRVSADGRHALSTGRDRLLRIWDLQETRLEHTLPIHSGGLYAVNGPYQVLQIVGGYTSPGLNLAAPVDPTPPTGEQLNPAARLQVLDIGSQKVVQTMTWPDGWFKSLSLSCDSRRLLSLSQDHRLALWDLASGETIVNHPIQAEKATAICCLARSNRALLAAPDGWLKIIDLESGRIDSLADGGQGALQAIAVYQQDQRALTAPRETISKDYDLQVWDLARGKPIARLEGHRDEVESLAVAPGERWAASGSADHSIIIWDLATYRPVHTLKGHTDRVRALCFLPDGRLVSASLDHTVRVWDIVLGRCLRTLHGHTDWVESLAYTPEGVFFSGSGDSTVRVWDPRDYTCLVTLECAPYSRITAMVYPSEGGTLVIADGDPILKSWHLLGGNAITVLQTEWPELRPVLAVARDMVVCVHAEPVLQVVDLDTGAVRQTLTGHIHRISAAAISSDGVWAVSGSEKGEVIVWDLGSGRVVHHLDSYSDRIRWIVIAPDEHTCLIGSSQHLAAWDLRSGQVIHTFQYGADFSRIALSPTGDRAAVCMRNHPKSEVVFWDLDSGVQRYGPELPGVFHSLRWLGDDRLLVLSGDSESRIIDVRSGRLIRQWRTREFKPNQSIGTLDSTWTISLGWSSTLQAWDTDQGTLLCAFTTDADMTTYALTPDRGTLVVGDKRGQVHFFRLENFPGMETQP